MAPSVSEKEWNHNWCVLPAGNQSSEAWRSSSRRSYAKGYWGYFYGSSTNIALLLQVLSNKWKDIPNSWWINYVFPVQKHKSEVRAKLLWCFVLLPLFLVEILLVLLEGLCTLIKTQSWSWILYGHISLVSLIAVEKQRSSWWGQRSRKTIHK